MYPSFPEDHSSLSPMRYPEEIKKVKLIIILKLILWALVHLPKGCTLTWVVRNETWSGRMSEKENGSPLPLGTKVRKEVLYCITQMHELIFVNTAKLLNEMSSEIERRAEGVRYY